MTAQGNVPDYQTPCIDGVRAERFRGSEQSIVELRIAGRSFKLPVVSLRREAIGEPKGTS